MGRTGVTVPFVVGALALKAGHNHSLNADDVRQVVDEITQHPVEGYVTEAPPWFHLTEAGRRALANVNRDPSNPAGYLKHLQTQKVSLSSVTESYLKEGLDCYVAGLFK